ncbi:hypothetical protein JRQ81_015900 [Phrynocephalus forsythii]|uniref:Uncharacterized protein n=1 Tax=Phrynocephalus forsythii TaxID=171643 RepID=A0A9Q0XVG0_9SAUR|nr:hypothetical protein JRQ81_015900 [Phrynocephalus forsythii]
MRGIEEMQLLTQGSGLVSALKIPKALQERSSRRNLEDNVIRNCSWYVSSMKGYRPLQLKNGSPRNPEQKIIKRVIALEGDIIKCEAGIHTPKVIFGGISQAADIQQ